MRIEANDRRGLERLLRCCACPVFALERVEALDAHRLLYRLPKPRLDGKTQLLLSPLELIQRLAALVPPPRRHRHRHHGVLAPNAPLRAAVTALIQQAPSDTPAQGQKTETPPSAVEGVWRSPARYLWAMLLARLYESMPLQCPFCSADMRIIACITDGTTVRRILKHIGDHRPGGKKAGDRHKPPNKTFRRSTRSPSPNLTNRQDSRFARPQAARRVLHREVQHAFQFDQTVSW